MYEWNDLVEGIILGVDLINIFNFSRVRLEIKTK